MRSPLRRPRPCTFAIVIEWIALSRIGFFEDLTWTSGLRDTATVVDLELVRKWIRNGGLELHGLRIVKRLLNQDGGRR